MKKMFIQGLILGVIMTIISGGHHKDILDGCKSISETAKDSYATIMEIQK